MKTEAEIMVIRAKAYSGLCAQGITQWWRDMFIYKNHGRDVMDLVFGEKPHLRVKGN